MAEINKLASTEIVRQGEQKLTGELKMKILHERNLMALETPDGDDNFFPKQYNNKPIQVRYPFK